MSRGGGDAPAGRGRCGVWLESPRRFRNKIIVCFGLFGNVVSVAPKRTAFSVLLRLLRILLCVLQTIHTSERTCPITIDKVGHAALVIAEAKIQLAGAAQMPHGRRTLRAIQRQPRRRWVKQAVVRETLVLQAEMGYQTMWTTATNNAKGNVTTRWHRATSND